MPHPPLTVGSLFSGIGGLELGLERAGMKTMWQVEWDNWCCQVLAKHWPNVTQYPMDIRDINPGLLEPVDLICGGFPCQPVSQAGRKEQPQDDPRWLWPEYFRIVRHLRPRYVVVENVPGLASRGMGDVLGDLASIGYDCEWESIPAAAVGAPHLRFRIFIVAYPNGGRRQSGRLPQPERIESPRRHIFDRRRPLRELQHPQGKGWWAVEPDVGRVAHGVPRRMDRLKGLGNAVVPQVAQWVGTQIIQHQQQETP